MSEHDTSQPVVKPKLKPKRRGRRPKYTPEQLEAKREGVNTLYHLTTCGVTRIAEHHEITIKQVNDLLLPRDEFLTS